MNTIKSVSSSAMYTQFYVPPVMPSMDLTKQQYGIPEKANAIQDRLYDDKAAQETVEQNKKQAIWETALMTSYIENQKNVIEAYVISATGEKEATTEQPALSLVETYKQLKAFQDEMLVIKPSEPSTPNNDIEIQPFNSKIEANLAQYQRNQYESVNSLLHLSV